MTTFVSVFSGQNVSEVHVSPNGVYMKIEKEQ
jgi:hypothetical protein